MPPVIPRLAVLLPGGPGGARGARDIRGARAGALPPRPSGAFPRAFADRRGDLRGNGGATRRNQEIARRGGLQGPIIFRFSRAKQGAIKR